MDDILLIMNLRIESTYKVPKEKKGHLPPWEYGDKFEVRCENIRIYDSIDGKPSSPSLKTFETILKRACLLKESQSLVIAEKTKDGGKNVSLVF